MYLPQQGQKQGCQAGKKVCAMPTAPMITQEERLLVKDAMIIPAMLEFLQNDINTVHKMGLKLDLVIIKSLQSVEQQIITEHLNVRNELRKRGIKIFSVEQSDAGLEGHYVCRGYRHRTELLWSTIRADILQKASYHAGVKLTGG
jgi:hypothetical protein